MVQYAVPINLINETGVDSGNCGGSPAWECIADGINGGSQDSGTYIQLDPPGFGDNGAIAVDLTSLSSPAAGSRIVRMTTYVSSFTVLDVNVTLYDGTDSETKTFTVSTSDSWELLSNTYTTDFDWSNLKADISYGQFGDFARVGDIELEIPDAGGGGGGEGPKLNPEFFLTML